MTWEDAGNHLLGTFIHLAAPAVSAALAVLAVSETTLVGQLVASLGASGVLAWYVWYHVKHVQPRMEARADQRETAMRSHYEGILEKIETADKEKNEKICRSLDGLACAVQDLSKAHQAAGGKEAGGDE